MSRDLSTIYLGPFISNKGQKVILFSFEFRHFSKTFGDFLISGDGQRAILKREDGKILKPIQPPPKGPREANFYLGQAHHMFSRFLNLHFFHEIVFVLFINKIMPNYF